MDLTIIRVFFSLCQLLYWYLEALFRLFVPPSMKSIDGEIILITGAAGGIGSEICRYIVQCGSKIKLIMWDLNISDLYKLAGELKSIGASDLEIFCYEVDISSRENIDNCCTQIKNEVGSVTIIFNNAGIAPFGNFIQLTNQQVEKVIDINLLSHFWIIRQFLPEMVTRNHGHIVNICSIGGLWGGHNLLPYYASKFGVNGYTEALKAELALFNHDGIHCTTVYPICVKTPLIKSIALDQNKPNKLPAIMQQFLEPEDVAKKTVDGMRREYEYIYLPSMIRFLRFGEYLVPNKFNKSIFMSYLKSFYYKDAEEQRRFATPLVPITTMKTKENVKKFN